MRQSYFSVTWHGYPQLLKTTLVVHFVNECTLLLAASWAADCRCATGTRLKRETYGARSSLEDSYDLEQVACEILVVVLVEAASLVADLSKPRIAIGLHCSVLEQTFTRQLHDN